MYAAYTDSRSIWSTSAVLLQPFQLPHIFIAVGFETARGDVQIFRCLQHVGEKLSLPLTLSYIYPTQNAKREFQLHTVLLSDTFRRFNTFLNHVFSTFLYIFRKPTNLLVHISLLVELLMLLSVLVLYESSVDVIVLTENYKNWFSDYIGKWSTNFFGFSVSEILRLVFLFFIQNVLY